MSVRIWRRGNECPSVVAAVYDRRWRLAFETDGHRPPLQLQTP